MIQIITLLYYNTVSQFSANLFQLVFDKLIKNDLKHWNQTFIFSKEMLQKGEIKKNADSHHSECTSLVHFLLFM